MGNFWRNLGNGIISGLTGNPLGTLINGFKAFSGIGEQKRQRKNQQKLMDYQDQINDANYEKQLADQRQLIAEDREYNSIGAQMDRARKAGVSPLAALGVSSGNSVSASSPSENGVSVPSPSRSSIAEIASSIRAAQLDKAQIDKTREEIENLRVERATEKLNQRKLELDNLILEMEQKGWTELRQKNLNKLEQEIAKLQRSAEVDAEVAQTERDTRQEKVNQLRASANSLNASAALSWSKHLSEDVMRDINQQLARSQLKVNAQQIAESISRENVNYQQVNNLVEQENLAFDQRRKIDEEIKNFQKSREKMSAEIANIESDTKLNDTRKQELISRVVANYTHSVTDVTDKLTKIFKNSGKSGGESSGLAESLVSDVLLGATGAVFD